MHIKLWISDRFQEIERCLQTDEFKNTWKLRLNCELRSYWSQNTVHFELFGLCLKKKKNYFQFPWIIRNDSRHWIDSTADMHIHLHLFISWCVLKMQFNSFLHLAKHHKIEFICKTASFICIDIESFTIGSWLRSKRLHFIGTTHTTLTSIENPKYNQIETYNIVNTYNIVFKWIIFTFYWNEFWRPSQPGGKYKCQYNNINGIVVLCVCACRH